MTKRDTKGVQSHEATGPVALTSRHLLGIEGMSPIEIRSLLDRGHMFADNPHDGVSDALAACWILQSALDAINDENARNQATSPSIND